MAMRVGAETASTRGPSRFGASPSSSSPASAAAAVTPRGPATGMALKPSVFAPFARSSSPSTCSASASSSSSSASSSAPALFRLLMTPRRVLRPAARSLSASRTASTTSGSRSPPSLPMSSFTSSSSSLCFSPPSVASFRRSARHSAMRLESSICGSSMSTSSLDPSKGSFGPCIRSSASMTFRSQTRPEPGSFTGSDMRCPMSASKNSSGSLSPILRASCELARLARSSISFWCSGTRSRL
mmetsp:Transcript_54628/g.97491  ORF Transcript_54628/g.97491 Transcript_54628/m.97491 type:complete len:242 (+) Transcript_54628:1190-1915(+)